MKRYIAAVIVIMMLALAVPCMAVPITDTNGGGLIGTNNALNVATTASVASREGQMALVATVTTRIIVANVNRISASIQNHGANAVWCGLSATITAATGPVLLPQYGTYVFDRTKSAIYCVSTAGTTIGYLEQY